MTDCAARTAWIAYYVDLADCIACIRKLWLALGDNQPITCYSILQYLLVGTVIIAHTVSQTSHLISYNTVQYPEYSLLVIFNFNYLLIPKVRRFKYKYPKFIVVEPFATINYRWHIFNSTKELRNRDYTLRHSPWRWSSLQYCNGQRRAVLDRLGLASDSVDQ
eukprot:scaffold1446_cov175-Ochromonas_danica.AAC.32